MTRCPRRTIGRLRCPIARTTGEPHASAAIGRGNDADAKPASRYSAGRRSAAVVVSSNKESELSAGRDRGPAGQARGKNLLALPTRAARRRTPATTKPTNESNLVASEIPRGQICNALNF
jgi:hypothetical protein